jgi:HK97 family phage major capsid protein
VSIQSLREERTTKAKEYRHVLDQNKGKLSEEEVAKLNELEVDISALEDRISREEKVLAMEAERLADNQFGEELKGKTTDNLAKALLNQWLAGGDNAITAEDWQYIRNTMSTTTGSEGGYTVQTEVAKTVLDAVKAYGGMREAAFVIQTAQGNPINWPTSDGTSEEGEILGENEQASDADITFGTKALPVYKYSSKVVTVPIELLQDSSIDVEAFINARIVQRLGRITNKHFTVGDASGKPNGVVTAVAVGKTGTSGQLTSLTYDDFVDLEHSVDPAYRAAPSCRFMFSDTALREMKKLKDSDSRPLWVPGLSSAAPATILNYPFTINQNVAVPAASAKSMLFGDFHKYVIRDVMAITYYRFTDSAYAKKGQVGFLAFMRSGGNYMDVGGAIKCFQHAAS